MFKTIVVSLSILFTSLFAIAATTTSTVLTAMVTLVDQNANLASDSKSCSVRSNVLGEVYVVANTLNALAQNNLAEYGSKVLTTTTLLTTYGVSSSADPCSPQSPYASLVSDKSFQELTSLLHDLRLEMNSLPN